MGPDLAPDIARVFDRLWPLMRSLTGEGVRATHDILGEIAPLRRIEVPTGTQVFDWTVPQEWIVREAYVIDPAGHRILDVRDHTLHLLNYCAPFRGEVTRAELDEHLHSSPDQPDAIPYVTSYHEHRWGMCLPHRQRLALPEGRYQVVIDTAFADGALTISEAVLEGESRMEVLFSVDTCHPSMANNELSGPLVAAFLCRMLSKQPRRLTYRFVFLPETIGSLAYLQLRGSLFRERLLAGYVLTCIGLDKPLTYKRSRRGHSLADRAAEYALGRGEGAPAEVIDFTPASFSSDERQYCSPGFNLPVGAISRGRIGEFPEYHTSRDNRDLVSFASMSQTVHALAGICDVLDANVTFKNLLPSGEPQLSKRGLYPTLGAPRDRRAAIDATMWVLNQSDGGHDLLAIAERSGIDIHVLAERARACREAGLLAAVDRAS
jgi:aminopeptidase-like protein